MTDEPNREAWAEPALRAVVRVGGGRGFVVEGVNFIGGLERYVVTAAHCLLRKGSRKLPIPHGWTSSDRVYKELLAPLGKKPSVWCECLFLDPIADIAVLGAPDNQELSEQAEAYEALVGDAALTVAEPPSTPIAKEVERVAELEKQIGATGLPVRRECPAFLLSLSNEWFPCRVAHGPNGMLNILDAARGIAGGMSGSPIVATDGAAIGVVCLGSGATTHELEAATEGGPNPRLIGNLPGWFLKSLGDAGKAAAAEDDADFEANPLPLVGELARNLAIYAGSTNDEAYLPQAREILKQYRAAHGRDPREYIEVEEFFLARQRGHHLRDVR